MSISSSDLVFYKSENSVTSDNNTDSTEVGSLGGGITVNTIASDTLDALFDDATADELSAGYTDYRCIYLSNKNQISTLYSPAVFIKTASTDSNTTFSLALDPAGVDAESEISLADEIDSTNLLSSLTFTSPTSYDDGLTFDNLDPNGYIAVWIKRTITAGNTNTGTVNVLISFTGLTEG